MNNLGKISFALILSALCVFSCESKKDAETTDAEPASFTVYTSNYPLYYFTSRVAPSNVEVRFPFTNTSDPAYWEIIPDTVNQMQSADLIFINGASYEQWLISVSLSTSTLVNTSESIVDKFITTDESVVHSHGEEGEHAHSKTAFTTWMDMELATAQAASIRDALIRIAPEHAAEIESNFESLRNDLNQLHQEFKTAADTELKVVFSHPVYQYFTNAYNLGGPSVHWEPDESLTDEMKHDFAHLAEEEGPFDIMIWEGTPLAENVEFLNSIGVRSIVISPCAALPDSGDFLEVMRKNIASLEATKVK
ncbi:metal ABC transporter substrate-binding protein [Fulvivirga sedimenti]|uniref:Metal ABC transporter substrate-binding protein n=1 Tax=Fulvivirga sedimenti TaxID=2879465 RepID=A0A9X1HU03_9BACT|nr:metal ABC transporter substrate-binding protein [Fulvivirga sedimenti]MCA6074970.1 metal ABC transporter substrate-binding protein [Fulvivirga sedimenti]MCA6076147.1 metal ABC transporter substrate-binding protein [Fulvivirga sedimenti]MCA6077275.1 metal ABC transporter substrate-binding protein [Fulvivirga sedimenti]